MSGLLIVPGGLGDGWRGGTFSNRHSWPGTWNKLSAEEYLGQWAPMPLPERDPFEFRIQSYMTRLPEPWHPVVTHDAFPLATEEEGNDNG